MALHLRVQRSQTAMQQTVFFAVYDVLQAKTICFFPGTSERLQVRQATPRHICPTVLRRNRAGKGVTAVSAVRWVSGVPGLRRQKSSRFTKETVTISRIHHQDCDAACIFRSSSNMEVCQVGKTSNTHARLKTQCNGNEKHGPKTSSFHVRIDLHA